MQSPDSSNTCMVQLDIAVFNTALATYFKHLYDKIVVLMTVFGNVLDHLL